MLKYRKKIYSSQYAIDTSGKTLVTETLQTLIDLASKEQACLVIEKGIYLTSSLFLKSNMEFHLSEGAVLLGTTCEEVYPILSTRVAGIEMDWYAGILNCDHQEQVVISGTGKIDGQGPYWWRKYWGTDGKGGMRKEYDERQLRWACDYDCMRVRNVVISNSHDITLKDFTSYQSGFWNIHLLYSEQIHVSGIHIESLDPYSPSTDGIDVDSCSHVLIEHCEMACNDDSIAIKSGRDEDGKRVGRPCEHIVIQNCSLHAGFGITIGSEVSGGIEDITIQNIHYNGTDCGFRIKSSKNRQGYIRNVLVDGLQLKNVKYLFHFCLNWNPNYCDCRLPEAYQGVVSEHWKTLVQLPLEDHKTNVEHIVIQNIEALEGIDRAFHIEGFADQPIADLNFKNMKIVCKEYGRIEFVDRMAFDQVTITVKEARNAANDIYDNR